jgi:hypothetical protein
VRTLREGGRTIRQRVPLTATAAFPAQWAHLDDGRTMGVVADASGQVHVGTIPVLVAGPHGSGHEITDELLAVADRATSSVAIHRRGKDGRPLGRPLARVVVDWSPTKATAQGPMATDGSPSGRGEQPVLADAVDYRQGEFGRARVMNGRIQYQASDGPIHLEVSRPNREYVGTALTEVTAPTEDTAASARLVVFNLTTGAAITSRTIEPARPPLVKFHHGQFKTSSTAVFQLLGMGVAELDLRMVVDYGRRMPGSNTRGRVVFAHPDGTEIPQSFPIPLEWRLDLSTRPRSACRLRATCGSARYCTR